VSRATRPQRVLHARDRLAILDALFAGFRRLDGPRGYRAFRKVAKCRTRPSILRGALLGRPVSARAAGRLLASLRAA